MDQKKKGGKSWGRWLLIAALLAAIVAVVAVVVSRRDNQRYREMVRAFYVGVAALDAGDKDRALERLSEATRIVPSEPAAWANLGLAQMQLGNLEAAEASLRRAETLAPRDPSIQSLWASLENVRGRAEEAVGRLEKALELDPSNVRARYALVETLRRLDAEGHGERIARLLDELLERSPDNLLLLLERAEVAALAEDRAALDGIVARLNERTEYWPEIAREQLRAVEGALEENDWSPATVRELRFLQNVLKPTPDFKAAVSELVTPVAQVGEPVYRFLTLRSPPSTAALPDEQLRYVRRRLETHPPGAEPVAVSALLAPAIGDAVEPARVAVGQRQVLRLDPPGEIATLPGPLAAQHADASRAPVLFVDWNRDFRLDLVLADRGGLKILEASDAGPFRDVTGDAGLPAEVTGGEYFGVWTLDTESDGDMDLLLAPLAGNPIVLRNNSDGTFARQDLFAGVEAPRALAWADFDADGDPDVGLLDGQGSLHIFDNRRSGRFIARNVPEDLPASRAVAVADIDNDGALEIVLLADNGQLIGLSDQDQGRAWRWEALTGPAETSAPAETAREGSDGQVPRDAEPPAAERAGWDWLAIADLDNNGALDAAAGMGTVTRVWLNHPEGLREHLTLDDFLLTDVEDVTGDGRLDLLGVSSDGNAVEMRGQGARDYHWQWVRARALAKAESRDSRMNSFALGSEIQVRAGLLTQMRVVDRPRVHFGLGRQARTDVARIVWPHGASQAEFELPADAAVTAEQRLIGSCPFLFAYNGESLEFVTDFLWRSPLGLRINAQDTAGVVQTEDWVKVRGDQLVPRRGVYDLRITADLWETHFFDHVSLLVVDHPRDVEVFVDERFCVPPPPLEVVVTTPPKPLTRVWDQDGRDVAERVRAIDRDYVDQFPLGLFQGVAQEHWVEGELGDEVPAEGPLVLVAHGFVYPTDSSINVSLSQGQHSPPRGLVLEVADGRGGWRLAADGLGFPSGKDKTVLIDLEGVFVPGAPRRFRLRTNLEVYWDQLSWALKRPGVSPRTERLAASVADLRYRGISRMHQAGRKRPDLPTYDSPSQAAGRWRDLVGYYTRFGDVRELLAGIDDRYVIMNAGDELRLEFPEVPPPPAGWKRDYVLIGDGWVKDGNLNTAFSRTVRPLPAHGAADYDTPPGALAEDPVYQRFPDDWRRYHTRYVDPEFFRRGLWSPAASPR